MATVAEPRPAVLPLPGGSQGATVRLHPFVAGVGAGPPAYFHREEGHMATPHALGFGVPRDTFLEIPVVAFLIEHPGAGPVLVDTGFHPSVAVDPRHNLGRLGALAWRDLRVDPAQTVPARLRAMGIDPADVPVVVMTHLHSDHASAMSEFPNATFVFSAREWDAAIRPRGDLRGYVRRQFDHGFDYRTIDFEAGGAESFTSFPRSIDLFADGAVRLVSTPGHTHGHLSVVVRLPDREALLIGDAAYTMRTLHDYHLPWMLADEHRFERSLTELKLYIKQTPSALVVPGHDIEVWDALEPVYG